jgi:hypothetical protein
MTCYYQNNISSNRTTERVLSNVQNYDVSKEDISYSKVPEIEDLIMLDAEV